MIDRADHRRGDRKWLAEAWERSRAFAVWQGQVSGFLDRKRLEGKLRTGELLEEKRLFLGVDSSDVPYFAVMVEVDGMVGLRALLEGALVEGETPLVEGETPLVERSLAVAAVALAHWHDGHQFHPRTAEPTTVLHGGWVRGTANGDLMWPRTSPAILALIHDGVAGDDGRCLLSRNVARPENFRSVTAGFVEPGERLEETVVRESFEELGVDVADIRYYASEPWPFADQLMVAFTATGDPEQPLVLDPAEIEAAAWYSRSRLRAELVAGNIVLPSPISISRQMIDDWLSGKL